MAAANASARPPLDDIQSSASLPRAKPSPRPHRRTDQPFQWDGAERQGTGNDFVQAVLDPAGLGLIPVTPLVPAAVLKKHHCFVSTDSRFRAAARLLSSLYREDRDMAAGSYRDGHGRHRKLGSRITAAAGRAGGNFINNSVARLVARELVYAEIGAVLERDRLLHNLLSSQPLCFNLFGPLKLDLALATAVFAELLPGFIDEVMDVRFESSPARGHAAFTGDGTAFDVLIRGRTHTGKRAFIAIEVKYTETGQEPLPRFTGRARFDEIAHTSDLFVDPADPALYTNPVQQLFRQSCLATAMLQNELFDTGIHLLIAPQGNQLALNAGAAFAAHLKDPVAGPLPFRTVPLEGLVGAIAAAGAIDLARALHRRYCDFWLVDGELELDEPAPTHEADDSGGDPATPADTANTGTAAFV